MCRSALLIAALSFGCGGDGAVFYAPDAASDTLDAASVAEEDWGGSGSDPDAGRPDVGTMSPGDAAGTSADAGDMGSPVEPGGPTRYDPGELLSALTPNVVDRMRTIRSASSTPDDAVFMKVGASGTVNSNFLDCIGSPALELGGHASLAPTVGHFDAVEFAGQSSWDRDTLAAMVGRTAGWVQTGSPSPLDQEIAAINPRFALVNYGTNDMQQGVTHESALWPFWDNMSALLDRLEARGVVPLVTGLNPRSDTTTAAQWVPTYNEVTRAMAQARQLPYLDLYNAVVTLDDRGLVSDGIHGNAAPGGACDFEAAGLEYNYNVRNLLTLRLLDGVRRTVVASSSASETSRLGWTGAGTPAEPFVVDELPFSHFADTSTAPSDSFDAYPACDGGQDESGPEVVYRLDLAAQTKLRVMAFDGDADVDVHHLVGAADPSACSARHDRILQGTFAPGTHYFVFDTYVGSSGELSGEFVMVVVECEPGDPACD